MEALRFFQFEGVERDRLRERERQARAQMSSQVADQESPGPSGNFLFREPIRVNPSSADPVTQQIQSKLGDFQRVRPFLDQKDSSGLIGVDGVPPSPGGPPPSRHHMSLPPGPVAGAPSRKRLLTWSRELSTKLIQLYEKYPCLYITNLSDYHDRNKRDGAYKEICEELNKTGLMTLSPVDVKKEIHGLRKQYFSEARKMEESVESKTSTDFKYSPTLWCFEKLSFLNESKKTAKTPESNSQKNVSVFQSEAPAEGGFDAEVIKSDTHTIRRGSAQSNSSANAASKKKRRLESKEDFQQLLASDASDLQNLLSEEPSANLLFGQLLASEMSKIDDENVVNKLKHDILNLLYEAKRKCRKT